MTEADEGNTTWDWRPLARLIVWVGLAFVAARKMHLRLPDPSAVWRELILGYLLTFGLLTWFQIWLALGALWILMALDDWTFGVSELVVRPIRGRSMAANFLAALSVQIGLVYAVSEVVRRGYPAALVSLLF